MKRTKMLVAAALVVFAAFWLSGCDSEPVVGPTAVTLPAQTPTAPTFPEPVSCTYTGYSIQSEGVGFDFKANEIINTTAAPVVGQQFVSPNACPGNFLKTGTWNVVGAFCTPGGNIGSMSVDWRCPFPAQQVVFTFCDFSTPSKCGSRSFQIKPEAN